MWRRPVVRRTGDQFDASQLTRTTKLGSQDRNHITFTHIAFAHNRFRFQRRDRRADLVGLTRTPDGYALADGPSQKTVYLDERTNEVILSFRFVATGQAASVEPNS